MTDDRSLERAARSWLETGPTEAPDRAVEAALLRIETTRQERDLRVPWRLPTMTTPARVAAAAVIGVLLIGGAYLYFGRPSQPSIGAPRPSPSVVAPSASARASTPAVDYSGLPGWVVRASSVQAPDGSTTTMDTDRRGIWMIHADGTGLHELAPGVPADGKTAPDISPDGTKVAFSVWDKAVQVWEVGIDGSNPHPGRIGTDGVAVTQARCGWPTSTWSGHAHRSRRQTASSRRSRSVRRGLGRAADHDGRTRWRLGGRPEHRLDRADRCRDEPCRHCGAAGRPGGERRRRRSGSAIDARTERAAAGRSASIRSRARSSRRSTCDTPRASRPGRRPRIRLGQLMAG